MNTKLPLRQRLLITTGLLAGTAVVIAGLLTFYRRPTDGYNPQDRQEGITAELERQLPVKYPHLSFTEVSSAAGLSFQHFYGSRSTQLP